MSMRYSNGAIIKPGFNPVLIPGAPTIGTVTAGIGQVIVAFTAPTDTGGSAITSYQVVSTPGSIIATGASSPITVTGLTSGTSYTFRVAAINSYGAGTFSAASASATPISAGQQAYTTPGTYTWVAPTGITSVSVVVVGGGGGSRRVNCCFNFNGGGGGGALRYLNNYTVVPGNSYTVQVGARGIGGTSGGSSGGQSFFVNTGTVVANGGTGTICSTGASGGTGSGGNGGGSGGNGGNFRIGGWGGPSGGGGGGGGAAGYSGNGGNGGAGGCSGSAGSGGGGGGGAGGIRNVSIAYVGSGGPGGGVGLLGQGANGAGGVASSIFGSISGVGGSGGAGTGNQSFCGNNYGGGGGGYPGNSACPCVGAGGVGAVRIIWPGNTRSFPSTNTGDL